MRRPCREAEKTGMFPVPSRSVDTQPARFDNALTQTRFQSNMQRFAQEMPDGAIDKLTSNDTQRGTSRFVSHSKNRFGTFPGGQRLKSWELSSEQIGHEGH
jgi:hypothetical protein